MTRTKPRPKPTFPSRTPLELIATGPVEVILGQAQLIVNDERGCILHIHSARSVVVCQPDFDETLMFGDLSPEPNSN